MAEDLYEHYAGLIDQQVDLAEKIVIGIVRAAFGDFSIDFKRHLRSLVPRRPPITNGYPSGHMDHAEEEIESARDSAQRQIATALANGFGALANLPSALGLSANHPSVPSLSGSPTQATVGANEANNNADISDDDSMSIKSEDTSECESDFESHSDGETEIKEEATEEDTNEMPVTAGTSNVNSNNNNDTVSVKSEIESECDSSDSESSDEEEEYITGREIKEEIDDGHSNDQIMGNSGNEDGSLQVMEDQVENEAQSIDNTNTIDSNFERSDAMMIENDEASNEGEGDDEPTIIVINYEEFEMQSSGILSNQDTLAEGSGNEESVNIAEPDGDFDDNVETANSFEDASEQQSVAVITEANSEQDQSGHPIVSNPTPTLTRRSTRAPGTVNHAEGMENSLLDQVGTSQTGTRKNKRKTDRSAKSNAPKRSRIAPAPTVAAQLQNQVNDDSENNDDPETEAISFRVIVRRLNCRVPGCKKVFPGKVQLDDHLLVKHAIEKFACKVKDCTESYATRGELTTHRNCAHDNLDNEWPCGQCEMTCNTYKDLRNHMNKYHEYGLFACSADKCDFTEKTRIKVHNHQRKHGPAKHRCTFAGCSSSFKQKSDLTIHLRVHSKEKAFLCSQCPKAFAKKSDLTVHERVHSGLKPFSCTWPHCDFSGSQQSNVIGHVRGVHFGLPETKKKQKERGIIDNRDARVFVKKTTIGN